MAMEILAIANVTLTKEKNSWKCLYPYRKLHVREWDYTPAARLQLQTRLIMRFLCSLNSINP